MATVNSTTANSNSALFASINGNSGSGTKTTSADEMQTRFLNLLVTQLKNQDPLNPMDNAQMTTQLSQISTVSGIEKLNSSLEKLLNAYSGTNTMQAAALIGKTVLTAGSKIEAGPYGGLGGVELETAADKVTVEIFNAAGNSVRTLQLGAQPAGSMNFVWDGKNDAGGALAQGAYSFKVRAAYGEAEVKSSALQAGTVNAVTLLKEGLKLQIGDSLSATYGDIKQILN